jgi:hypothetical protein
MKRLYLFLFAGTLALLWAGASASNGVAKDTRLSTPQSMTLSGTAKTEAFTGHIEQAEGKYVLVDEGQRATFQLDDQEKAKTYDGKNVKVTGSLDTTTNTIHVDEIVEV